jgi:hypothetical protein
MSLALVCGFLAGCAAIGLGTAIAHFLAGHARCRHARRLRPLPAATVRALDRAGRANRLRLPEVK